MKHSAGATRQLLLLHHGKAAGASSIEDVDRPLTDKGKRGAQRMGVWLLRQELIPDCIVTSPAERAQTTAQKALKAMAQSATGIVVDERLYRAGRKQLIHVLADCPPQSQTVMLVGHNPALDKLLQHLVAANSKKPHKAHLATASLARLQLPADWSSLRPGCGRLLSLTRARELPAKFPFPDAASSELRDRPAYYYTQSSVIPYRIADGRLEILITGSSQMKHWVVPKGIADPGYSLQASAAKEAYEEAGVEGTVDSEALGSYQYQKWGATCTVHVYPMAVSTVLPDAQWPERHRRRQWVCATEAAAQLKQVELAPMVDALAARLANS